MRAYRNETDPGLSPGARLDEYFRIRSRALAAWYGAMAQYANGRGLRLLAAECERAAAHWRSL